MLFIYSNKIKFWKYFIVFLQLATLLYIKNINTNIIKYNLNIDWYNK